MLEFYNYDVKLKSVNIFIIYNIILGLDYIKDSIKITFITNIQMTGT